MGIKILRFTFPVFISLILLGGIFFYQQTRFNDGKLHVVFCNVGQGDGIFIRTPKGNDILIDAGPNDSILTCLSSHMPFWDHDLELAILSHSHADHITGLITVLKRYSVMSLATFKVENNSNSAYQEILKLLKEQKIKQRFLKPSDKFITDDQVVLKTEWPEKDISNISKIKGITTTASYYNLNELSLIELLSYRNFNLLLTGDAEKEAEEKIAPSLGKIDILKVSHHGSKTGTSEDFLKTIRPKLAVISVGKKNRYGLPSLTVLEIFKKLGIKIMRTDQDGEIEIISDGKKWMVK